MSWARLDDQIAFHAKVVDAGNEAFGAWVRMLALSCAQLTDGYVTSRTAGTITTKRMLDRLVECRLLDEADGGYRIHDFHHWNPPSSSVRAKREADRTRKAAGRANQGRSANGRMSGGNPRGQPPDDRAPSYRIPPTCPPVPSPVSRLPSSDTNLESTASTFQVYASTASCANDAPENQQRPGLAPRRQSGDLR